MLRRLATALACVLFAISPNLPGPQPKSAPSPKSATPSAARPDDIATEAAEKPSPPRDTRGNHRYLEAVVARPSVGDQVSAMGPSIEAAIGSESDAKIEMRRQQVTPSRPLTRESICQVVSEVAQENSLPAPLFKRLIWQESRFRSDVVSRAGARGIAQFMPGTAAERGLKNPFDPIQALPASGAFLRDLIGQFGNFGLAAAAYNGGPSRVSRWLAGKGGLPSETRNYVVQITGRTAEHWAEGSVRAEPHPEAVDVKGCEVQPLRAAAELQNTKRVDADSPSPVNAVGRVAATWIALLTGNWSQQRAQSVYASLQKKYPKVFARRSPTVRVAKSPGKRSAPKTVVRLVAESRAEAEELCRRLREVGGSCTVRKDPT
jgi:hypothetical protein